MSLRSGKATLTILGITVLLWLTSGQTGLHAGVIALLAAAALTALGVLERHDVDSIDWDIIILMWGGLSLGIAMQKSGLIGYLGCVDLMALPGGTWALGIVIALLGMGVSTFMNNTATAALLVPMALALSVSGKEQLVMLVALACSFAMAMPVSTRGATTSDDLAGPAGLRCTGAEARRHVCRKLPALRHRRHG